jgi:hypothetical protein
MITEKLGGDMLLTLLLACVAEKEIENEAVCEETTSITCEDQIISDLSLHDDQGAGYAGSVSTTTEGNDFLTSVDASAGGYNEATSNPWVYVKFTAEGAEQVLIDDETALNSLDWDMALKRFIIRLNGGTSGGSCVAAASLLEGVYQDLIEVPEGISYVPDNYYTDDCTFINDSSGLPGSPQVSLSPWWSYGESGGGNCVKTSNVPHLIQLADASILKLVIESYYATGQEGCNDGSSGPGEDSGNYTLRWQILQ